MKLPCKTCGKPMVTAVRNGIRAKRKCPSCSPAKPKCRRADKRIRTGSYGKLPKGWKGLERPKQCDLCPYVGDTLIHHLVPRRLALEHGDPDVRLNQMHLGRKCPCHGRMNRLERAILSADWVTASREFDAMQMPRERVLAAFDYYGLAYGLKRIWRVGE